MTQKPAHTRIKALRQKMAAQGIQAVIIPQTDPHHSEYLAAHWQVRRWLSGFTGSAGDLLVTTDQAYLWADSRYWLQAAAQLAGTPIQVMEDGKPSTPTITEFLTDTLAPSSTVAIDGMLFSLTEATELSHTLQSHSINLRTDFDPAHDLWSERPEIPAAPAYIHPSQYAGQEPTEKISQILQNAKSHGAQAVFIPDLAEIAWTLNIRGTDVTCNPVVTSYFLLTPTLKTLFIDPRKLTPELSAHLTAAGIDTLPYTDTASHLASLPADLRVLIDPERTSVTLAEILGPRAIHAKSPAALLKACKNPTQIQGFRQAMIRDGVALVQTFIDIEDTLAAGRTLTEIQADDLAHDYRRTYPQYRDKSFMSASAYGSNGAIVHYEAEPETCATLRPDSLWLYDSGVNYIDGTTDITRTVTLGNPTPQQRTDFTLVMKGHIAIASAVFPEGTRGAQLDAMARMPLWKHGLSYLHGTGHGVGHFLNVHEGPQSIRLNDTHAPLLPGMITSNEPGLYREGKWGIRCENLILTIPAFETEFGRFLRFETLTLFPFDLRLFDTSIMTDEEIRWVNEYHLKVRTELQPHLTTDRQRQWLTQKTQPLTK